MLHWLFHLYHHITYISRFVASYLLLLWYVWSLWRCFELLLEEIQFFSHVHVFSCEILHVICLKRQLSCFSSHFSFLVISVFLILVLSVFFPVTLISPPPFFSMQSSSRYIDQSTQFSILARYNQFAVMVDSIILLSGLFGPRVFLLAFKLAKILEQKCQWNWKVQASAPRPGYGTCHFYSGRPNVNKIDSCLVTNLIELMKNTVKNWEHVWDDAITLWDDITRTIFWIWIYKNLRILKKMLEVGIQRV